MPSYELVRYDPSMRNQIVSHQVKLWCDDLAVNAAHFEWKYETNPYLDSPLAYLAIHEDTVVGMIGMMGAMWQAGSTGRRFAVPIEADGIVRPEHQKQGLFSRLNAFALDDLAAQGHSFAFALSAGPIPYAAMLRMAWHLAGAYDIVVRPAPATFHRGRTGVGNGVQISREPRPEDMAELIERLPFDGRIRHLRDQRFFDWRFGNPLCEYTFFFHGEAALDGYLVLQRRLFRIRSEISIVDWEASDLEVLTALLDAAVTYNDAPIITCSATLPDRVQDCLVDFDFAPAPYGRSYHPSALVWALREDDADDRWMLADRSLADLANWDFRLIYSDGF